MTVTRFAFILEQNGRKLRLAAMSLPIFFAFMFLAGPTTAQKVFKEDVPIEKINLQIEHLTETLAQVPTNQTNTVKVQYYQAYLGYLQAVQEDMQNGDSYAVAVKNNRALMPVHPNQSAPQSLRNKAVAGNQNNGVPEGSKKSQYSKKKDN
jgi:hypothetical protein